MQLNNRQKVWYGLVLWHINHGMVWFYGISTMVWFGFMAYQPRYGLVLWHINHGMVWFYGISTMVWFGFMGYQIHFYTYKQFYFKIELFQTIKFSISTLFSSM